MKTSGGRLLARICVCSVIGIVGCGGSSSTDVPGAEGGTTLAANPGVKFVGFDCSPPLVEALRAGQIQGLVLQNPFQMGKRSVETIVAALDGKAIEPSISTGE